MSEAPASRHLLILALGVPKVGTPLPPAPGAEVFVLTEDNAGEALEKIFAADAVAVWGHVADA